MPFQLELFDRFVRGSVLIAPPDLIPDGTFRALLNARVDQEHGTITSRPGLTRRTASAIGVGPIRALALRFGTNAAGYVHSHTALYRTTTGWESPQLVASGIGVSVLSHAAFVDGFLGQWLFLVNAAHASKDNGVNNYPLGVAPPARLPKVTKGAWLRVALNDCDAHTEWAGSGISGLATSTTIVQEGTGSITFAVAAGAVGAVSVGFTGASAFVSGTHTGGNNLAYLADATKDFVALGVKIGCRVRNTTDGCEGRVTRISTTGSANDTLLFTAGLSGGADNDFDTGDAYEIYPNLLSFQRVVTSGTDNSGVSNKTTRLTDTAKDFVAAGVLPGMTLYNTADGSTGIITAISTTLSEHDTLLCAGGLEGGTDNDVDHGDTYRVWDTLVEDDDYLHLWIRCDRPDWLEYVQLDLDCDTATLANAFRTNYFTVRLPAISWLEQGRDSWTELLIRKSACTIIGAASWENIRAIRLSVHPSVQGAVTIYVDDLSLVGGYGLEGKLEYTLVYQHSGTGATGNPLKDAEAFVQYTQAVEVNRHPVVLDLTEVAQGGAGHPGDSQIDTIKLYRRGGTLIAPILVDSFVDTQASYTDTKADSTLALSAQLETDNDQPPQGKALAGPGALHRLFLLVGRTDLYYSKAWEVEQHRAENWPEHFHLTIGDGSSETQNLLVVDTQVFVWTTTETWQVVGSGADTFLPVLVPESQGLAAAQALAFGDGQIFFLAPDGIYSQQGVRQQILTEALDPFFLGQTMAETGIVPLNREAMGTCRLQWYAAPEGPLVVLAYPGGAETTPTHRLVLKKHLETGQYTEAFFDSGIAIHAMVVDTSAHTLIGGGADGHVYRLEDPEATGDAGAEIALRVLTKSHNQGRPRQQKSYSDVVLEADTQGETLRLRALTNRLTVPEELAPVITTAPLQVQRLLADPEAQALDFGLLLYGFVTERVTLYRFGWHYLVHPEALIFWDSDEVSFQRRTLLKGLHVDIVAQAPVTIRLYVDGIPRDSRPLHPTWKRERVEHLVPAGLWAKTLRVTCQADEPFQLWSLVAKLKAVGGQRGYTEQPLVAFGG